MNRLEMVRRLKAVAGRAAADSRPWYRITAEADGPARVDVYDEIGGSWFSDGVSASDFVASLAAIPAARELHVHINSPGGDVFDGIAIYNAIAQRPGPVTTVVDGLAASAASFIAQAGKTRVVSPGSMMMIHDASGICIGNAADMRELAGLLDQVSGNLADIYAAHAGKSAPEWRDAMQAETWYKATDAVSAGLADKLAERPAPEGATARFDLAVFAKVPAWLTAAEGSDDGEGSGQTCKTCGGTGRLKHPGTGKNGVKCPGCGGSGQYDPDSGDDEDDDGQDDDGAGDATNAAEDEGETCPTCKGTGKIMQGHRTCPDCNGTGKVPEGEQDRAPRRILGIESMPLLDKAIPVHHTATVDTPWDGPAAVAAMPAEYADLHYCHAWQAADADASSHTPGDDDADDKKGNFKFPHHAKLSGPANLPACRNGLARLSGADIPAGDEGGVKAHLQAHLDDGSKDDSGAGSHAHADISGIDLEQLGSALRGAFA
ncbi:MAG: head maturation protease, ClpP-related [Streptosporangiaceae bacterium]